MNQPTRLLILHGISSLRSTAETEVIASLSDDEARLPRIVLTLDTRGHEQSVASGYWSPVEAHVRAFAAQVLADLEDNGSAAVKYMGIDEVPTLVALAAFLGDEHRIGCQDYDRDLERFRWPDENAGLALESSGVPQEAVEAAGEVVLRIELSYVVHDEHVDQAVSATRRIADVVIRPQGVSPRPGLLRSQADVETLRLTVREILAELERTRPGTQTIHLFLAGPVSACLAVGQELRLRNGRRVQTYRYRSHDAPPQTPAILLTPEASVDVQMPLTGEERARADTIRGHWREALAQVYEHAQVLRDVGTWPAYLVPELAGADPCPEELAPIWNLVGREDTISPDDATEFRFDRTARTWVFPDRMLMAMAVAADGDEDRARRLARAFFWHEYLHEYQYLTQHTALGIGAFANCLERLDYIADAYGTLHQVDFSLRQTGRQLSEAEIIGLVRTSITEAIDAFWTFEPAAPTSIWQARRLRRYLNWYWRREQIGSSSSLTGAIALLCQPPVIELVGPPISTDSRRVYLDLARMRSTGGLELALVDERNRLQRFPTHTNLSMSGLLEAFRQHDRPGIDRFFESLIDHARQRA